MSRVLTTFFAALLAVGAYAQESSGPAAEETATGDQAANTAESAVSAGTEAEAKVEQKKEFKPPPGFREKKVGGKVVYCRKDMSTGTRFKTEQCLDENQIKDYLLAQEQQRAEVDRMRAVCASSKVCAVQ